MNAPEFSRPVDIRGITAQPVRIEADEAERKALARRFEIVAIRRLEAVVELEADGAEIAATGALEADVVQSCAVSGDDLPVAIREPLTLRFVPEREVTEEEIELKAEELDEIPYNGTVFDLGEWRSSVASRRRSVRGASLPPLLLRRSVASACSAVAATFGAHSLERS